MQLLVSYLFLTLFSSGPNATLSLGELHREKIACSNINSEYRENGPIICPDGKTMFFSRSNHPDNKGDFNDLEDIWMAPIGEAGNWSEPAPFSELNTLGPNFINSVALQNGEPILILGNQYTHRGMKSGLSYSKRVNGKWSRPKAYEIDGYENFGANVNFSVNDDASILITSGNLSWYKKDRDLYISTLVDEGRWSIPIRISGINTGGNEVSPYLYENKYLFFASDSLGGYGGLDLFVTKRLNDQSWDEWSVPVNLGPTFNDENDNAYFFYSKALNSAFITREIDGNNDIYQIETFIEEDIFKPLETEVSCNSRRFFSTLEAESDRLSSQKCIEFELASSQSSSREFLWSFGDGVTGVGTTGSHCYDTPGTYDVSMTMIDKVNSFHFYDEFVETVHILPDVNLEMISVPDTVETGLKSTFHGKLNMIDPAISDLNFYWSFGDGDYQCGQYAEHQFKMKREYEVSFACSFMLDGEYIELSKQLKVVAK